MDFSNYITISDTEYVIATNTLEIGDGFINSYYLYKTNTADNGEKIC